jgi:WD40-like Beta Propeller Repeat
LTRNAKASAIREQPGALFEKFEIYLEENMTNRLRIQMWRLLSTVLVAIPLLTVFCLAAAAQQFGPWSAPVNLGSTVNSACDDQHPTLSKGGLSLIFSSTRPQDPILNSCDVALHLWVSRRDSLDSPWQTPLPLTMLNSPDNSPFFDYAPNLTTDGHWLFFHSSRSEGSCTGGGLAELWAAHRQDNHDDFGWETPINLGCTLNISGASDAGPNFWEDDTTGTLYLYFTRNLMPANPDGFSIYLSTCNADLESCNRQQLWGTAELIGELSSSVRDTRTAIRRRDGLEMIVTSRRCNSPIPAIDAHLCSTLSAGGLDLWVSTRDAVQLSQENWSIPVDLNHDNLNKCSQLGIAPCPVVNTSVNDGAPALSWDGQTMIFYSNRPGGSGGNDLYVSTRTKVTGPN